ncbi:MAG: hypothetical protein WAM30_14120 [Candidatus Dormiibacterota bacterium]
MRKQLTEVIATLAALLLLVGASSVVAQAAGGATNRLPIANSQVYANGVNLPWVNYGNDIGGNAWGEYGFHADSSTLQADFAKMRSQGVTTARVWLFADGRAGITFDSNGAPTGLDPEVFADLDALTSAARANGVHLNLVLFDSQFMFGAASLGNGVVSGGHGGLINDGTGGQALEQNVVLPVLKHLSGNPAVFSIETMNEPEACIADDNDLNSRCQSQPGSLANFNAWTQMIVRDVHANVRGALVTVGSASSNWVAQYKGDGLDYYEVHSYDDGYAPSLEARAASSFGLNAPIVVGEYPASPQASPLTSKMNAYYSEGYAGAWVWSFAGVDSVGTYDGSTMTAWNAAHPATDVSGSLPATSPSASPVPVPTASATPVTTPTPRPSATPAPGPAASATPIPTLSATPRPPHRAGPGPWWGGSCRVHFHWHWMRGWCIGPFALV